MVKLYRKKEKMWKEDKLQIRKDDDAPAQSMVIPAKVDTPKKSESESPAKPKKNSGASPDQGRPVTSRLMGKGGQEHPKRHSTSALTKQFRVTPLNVLISTFSFFANLGAQSLAEPLARRRLLSHSSSSLCCLLLRACFGSFYYRPFFTQSISAGSSLGGLKSRAQHARAHCGDR